MAGDIKVGTYEGTGAAIDIELGFVPDYIRVWNAEDGDASWEWFNGMAAANVLATANHDTAQQSLVTSNGITALEPTDYSTTKGFTVGTALSESGKTFRYTAVRSGDY